MTEMDRNESEIRSSLTRIEASLEEVKKKEEEKDTWDKSNIVASILSAVFGALIASAGWYFTSVYNQAQIAFNENSTRLKEIDLTGQLIPHLEVDGSSRKAALLTIAAIGNRALMVELALLYGGQGAADAVTEVAANAEREASDEEWKALVAAYESIMNASPEMIIAESGYASEVREKEVVVMKTLPELSLRTVEIEDPETNERKTIELPFSTYKQVQETVTAPYTVWVPRASATDEGADLDDVVRELLADGPKAFDDLANKVAERLNIPEAKLPALRRELTWRTTRITSGANAGLVELSDRKFPSVALGARILESEPEMPSPDVAPDGNGDGDNGIGIRRPIRVVPRPIRVVPNFEP